MKKASFLERLVIMMVGDRIIFALSTVFMISLMATFTAIYWFSSEDLRSHLLFGLASMCAAAGWLKVVLKSKD